MEKDDLGQDAMNCGQDGKTALARGVELFNAREFFHAHEVWEDWWRATTRPGKQTIQGMIQIAVAMHHHSRGGTLGNGASVTKFGRDE
jgi:predicted metal-dependent hydrolase